MIAAALAQSWFAVENLADTISPSLLIYPDRVQENIRRMIAMAGDVRRLRPHIKTHKLREVVKMHLDAGITKFKAATIAEGEILGESGAIDVLLAYPPVGPNAARLCELIHRFPRTAYSVIVDDLQMVEALAAEARRQALQIRTLIDIDCGQHRTGVPAGEQALTLYRKLKESPGLTFGGLHVYDGHIHDSDPALREERCEQAFAAVARLREKLEAQGESGIRIVAGGTPTFPIHARRRDVELSPGTCVLWDQGYATRFPDLDFIIAALVLTRVVSKPGPGLLCLDLGHKAVAAENPPPRVHFLNLPDAKAVAHSEEHLVVETPDAERWRVGDCLYGAPWHICPTVALHSCVLVVERHRVVSEWEVIGRRRRISV